MNPEWLWKIVIRLFFFSFFSAHPPFDHCVFSRSCNGWSTASNLGADPVFYLALQWYLKYGTVIKCLACLRLFLLSLAAFIQRVKISLTLFFLSDAELRNTTPRLFIVPWIWRQEASLQRWNTRLCVGGCCPDPTAGSRRTFKSF